MSYTAPTAFPVEIVFDSSVSFVAPTGSGPHEIVFQDAVPSGTPAHLFFLVM